MSRAAETVRNVRPSVHLPIYLPTFKRLSENYLNFQKTEKFKTISIMLYIMPCTLKNKVVTLIICISKLRLDVSKSYKASDFTNNEIK